MGWGAQEYGWLGWRAEVKGWDVYVYDMRGRAGV